MKKRLLGICLLITVFLLCLPSAMAMSTQEKESSYAAAIRELEAYLESNNHAPQDLEPIRAAFEKLAQYGQSNSFKYYAIVLMRVENNEFGTSTDLYLDMLDSERFNKALEDLPDTPIGTAQELAAYVHGRECEYRGDTEKACKYYAECKAFYDASDRYLTLENERIEKTYQEAVALFDAGRYQEAQALFQTVGRHLDSEVYLDIIATELAHVWVEADCTHPITCTHCGRTEGEPLGHDWQAATCTAPKTCARCGKTSGKKLGHDWQDATCTDPKTCKRCGTTSGKKLGHDWEDATCTDPKTCKRCGETSGKALGHDWQDATCADPKTCARCGKTSGKKLGHDWQEATYATPKLCKRCKVTEGERLPMPKYTDQSKDFEYYIDGSQAIITKYNGTEKIICFPSSLGGKPVKTITGILNYSSSINMEAVIIPEGVTKIEDAAFYDCPMTAIYLPASLNSIGNEAFTYCTRLGWIQVDPGNKHFTVVDDVLFTKSMDTLIRYFNPLGPKDYTVPKSVKNIASGAFTRCSLETITLPEGVESLGRLTFEGCGSLKTISIPSTVAEIHDLTFDQNALESIEVSSKNKHYASRDGVLYSKNFDRLIQYPVNKPDREFTIPDTVKEVNHYAFRGNSYLEELRLPKNMTSIDDSMFFTCYNLHKVELPDGITRIDEWAFGYVTDLTIYIPASVTFIDERAFYECKKVTIEGIQGSYAQKYAEKYHIPFVAK